MKRLKYLLILSLALLAASCSKDDGFAPGTDDNPGGDLQEFTFTVGMDYTLEGENGTAAPMAKSPATRAIEDDTPTRCLMEVFDVANFETEDLRGVQQGVINADGSFTFTVKLKGGNTYKFCFWADNGDEEITSLKAVPYTIGTVAFAATKECWVNEMKGVTLKHVVTKVSLATTAATAIDGDVTLATQCATKYNALDEGTVTASAEQTYSASVSDSYGPDDKADVVSCYVIPTTEKQDITIGCHLLTQTIADVPLAPNTHVTLRGDLSENNENWRATDEYIVAQMNAYFFGADGNPIGQQTTPNEYLLNGTTEDVNKFFQKITRNPDFSVDSGERLWVIGSGYGDKHYLFLRCYDTMGVYVNINWYRDSESTTWTVREDSFLPKFPTVEP